MVRTYESTDNFLHLGETNNKTQEVSLDCRLMGYTRQPSSVAFITFIVYCTVQYYSIVRMRLQATTVD